MHILKTLFAILIKPIILVVDLLFKPKNNLLEWHMNFEPFFMKIKTKSNKDVMSDNLLITSFLLYLSRYFFICDNRQTDIVRNFFINEIKAGEGSLLISLSMYDLIHTTLNDAEKNIADKIFISFVGSRVPAIYSEEEFQKRSFGKYSFLVCKDGDKLRTYLNFSLGLDIILLPLSTVLLYVFVASKLQNKNNKKILKNV